MDTPIRFFGAKLHPWTLEETLEIIKARIHNGEFVHHGVVNVAKLVYMQKDRELFSAVESCDIINADGMGVVWGARLLGLRFPERVAGIDLFEHLLSMAEEESFGVFFLGAREAVLEELLGVVRDRHPALRISGSHHGYFWDREEEVVDAIRESGATMLFVGISTPLKEMFINRWRGRLGVQFAMGVGGSFDVLAGKTNRAPNWMQAWGLEWLYRLSQEPGRMFKRYFYTNAIYAWMLLRARFSSNPPGCEAN